MRGEAKHRAGVNDGGACHAHIGGHVLHAGVGAAGPRVVAHGVSVVEGRTQLRQSGPAVEVKRLVCAPIMNSVHGACKGLHGPKCNIKHVFIWEIFVLIF